MGRNRKALKSDVPPASLFMEEMAWWFDAARQHLTYGDVRDYAVAAGVVFRAMARFCGEGNARLLFANASTPPKKLSKHGRDNACC